MNALAPFACPRCAVALVPAAQELVDRGASSCPQCHGLFLDDVRAYREIESVARPALVEIRRIPDAEAQKEPLPCPRCGVESLMHKGVSERDRKVTVDVCPKCGGAWLDGGELDAIQVDSLPRFLATVARWISEA